MSGQLAPIGTIADDETMQGVCDWVLGGEVIYLCPEGLKQFARGVQRLLDEKAAYPPDPIIIDPPPSRPVRSETA